MTIGTVLSIAEVAATLAFAVFDAVKPLAKK
jgi:hypothetical protein